MLIAIAALSLFSADMQAAGMTLSRPEPPRTRRQREADARNEITEGERAGDGATPERLICDWRRVQGSNRRERVCQTVADRRAARDIARDTLMSMQGSVTWPPGTVPGPGERPQ